MTTSSSSNLARLAVIRTAVLAGVLVIGAVAFWQHRQPDWSRASASQVRPLRMMGTGAWVIAVLGIIALRMKFARDVERGSNPKIHIIGWALGELPAIFGAVYYFMTDDATIYLAGVGAMLVAFTLFPVARRQS